MVSRFHWTAWLLTAAVPLLVLGGCSKKLPTSPTATSSITTPVDTLTTPASPVAQPPSRGPIAFVSDRDGGKAIYLANADGSGVTRLTSGDGPAWAPGGLRLAFQRSGSIYVIGSDGSGESRVVAGSHPSWSPDGTALIFGATDGSIDRVNVDGSDFRLVFNPAVWNSAYADYAAIGPSWSPDGRSVAFIRASYDDSWALFVVDVDGKTAPRLLAQNTSESTSWSADGSRIAYGYAPGIVNIVQADGSTFMPGPNGFYAAWTPTGTLIFNQFTGPGDASSRLGGRMRIFLSTASRAMIPEAVAPARPDYWDQQAVWAR